MYTENITDQDLILHFKVKGPNICVCMFAHFNTLPVYLQLLVNDMVGFANTAQAQDSALAEILQKAFNPSRVALDSVGLLARPSCSVFHGLATNVLTHIFIACKIKITSA